MLKSLFMLSMLVITTAPAAAGEAADAVKFFYDNLGDETLPENRNRFTGPALDFLNSADAAWERDETVCIDFGFAVDAQDFDDVEIAKTLTLDETVNGDTADVTASFENFGQATQVEWSLKKSAGGWKVSDIGSAVNDWRLSAMSCE
ncbi:hypothetical protein [Hoeflea sp.]|uniref:hypothetical protein n=1 Tax=Hoeflea sp. TaxID=1940281 RepID=UPI00198F0E87|nr:hypothetical protein [Hoeflea sp.]MBC7280149.1 hypothetical protein [Hoeflea sp.]